MASAQRLAVLAFITPPSKGSELVPRCMPITRIRKNRQCYFRKPSQFTRMKCGFINPVIVHPCTESFLSRETS